MEVRFNSRTPTAVAGLDGLVTVSLQLLLLSCPISLGGSRGNDHGIPKRFKQPKLLERVRITIRPK